MISFRIWLLAWAVWPALLQATPTATDFLAVGDRAGAVKLLRDQAAEQPGSLTAQLAYADFLTEHGKGDELAERLAIDCLQAAMASRPGEPELIRRLFGVHLAAGRKDAALALLPPDGPLRAELSRRIEEMEESAKRERMDEHHELALSANPADAGIANAAAEYFRESGRLGRAIDVLERHVAAAPASLELMTRLGVFHFLAKQDPQGEAVLKKVLEIDPQQALAHQSLAKFYESVQKDKLARHHRAEVLELRGGSAGEFLQLGEDLMVAGEPSPARILLDKAVGKHPGHAGLAAARAIATRRDPETRAQAAPLFRTAIAAGAELSPTFQWEFAGVLIDEGQPAEAEERLRQAIRGFPPEAARETAAALRQLAGLWESQDRNAAAGRALLQRAAALERTSPAR